SGDLIRLKPHIDFQAVCFKVVTRGPLTCYPDIEMWSDGERVDRPKYGADTDPDADELTLSWRRKTDPTGQTFSFSLMVGGMVSYKRVILKPVSKQKTGVAFGPRAIKQPVELKAVGDSAIVWAMGGGKPGDLGKPKDVEKMLNTAPWVLVLRLTAENKR